MNNKTQQWFALVILVTYVLFFRFLRNALLRIAQVNEQDYTVIPLNGNAALATEATIRTVMVPKKGKVRYF